MITILVVNQKGGCGKTMIAGELAFALERRSKTVSFVDLDRQGGTARKTSRTTGDEDFQVVDTPGALNEDFQNWCRQADLIIMPVLASPSDFPAFQRCYKMAVSAGVPKQRIGVILNRYDGRREVDTQFMELLSGGEYQVWGTIPTATIFAKAVGQQTSSYDLDKNSKASMAIEGIADQVMKESEYIG